MADGTAVQQALNETYQSNRALLSGLNAADMDRPTANSGWKVGQLAAHIARRLLVPNLHSQHFGTAFSSQLPAIRVITFADH